MNTGASQDLVLGHISVRKPINLRRRLSEEGFQIFLFDPNVAATLSVRVGFEEY